MQLFEALDVYTLRTTLKTYNMKKLTLALLVAVLALSGCVKEDNLTQRSWLLTARSSDWESAPTGAPYTDYYYVDFPIDGLNDYIYSQGNVSIYLLSNIDGRQIQQQLPLVRPTYADDNFSIKWTEVIDYEYERGWIRVKVTYDNFDYDNIPAPGYREFRMVITW